MRRAEAGRGQEPYLRVLIIGSALTDYEAGIVRRVGTYSLGPVTCFDVSGDE